MFSDSDDGGGFITDLIRKSLTPYQPEDNPSPLLPPVAEQESSLLPPVQPPIQPPVPVVLPAYGAQMATDWNGFYQGLTPDQKKGADLATNNGSPDGVKRTQNSWWIAERSGRSPRAVEQNYEAARSSFAELSGWGTAAGLDDAAFNQKVVERAEAEKQEDEMVYGLRPGGEATPGGYKGTVMPTATVMESQKKSLISRAYNSAAEEMGDATKPSDMAEDFMKFDEQNKDKLLPDNINRRWQLWQAYYEQGREDRTKANIAAKQAFPILARAGDIGGADVTAAVPFFRGLSDKQQRMAMEKLVEMSGNPKYGGSQSGVQEAEPENSMFDGTPVEHEVKQLEGQLFVSAGRMQNEFWTNAGEEAERDQLKNIRFKAGDQLPLNSQNPTGEDILHARIASDAQADAVGASEGYYNPDPDKTIPLTAEQAADANKAVKQRLGDIEMAHTLRGYARDTLNGLKTESLPQYIAQGIGQAGTFIAYTATPFGAPVRFMSYKHNAYMDLRAKGLSEEDADRVAPYVAAAQAGADQLSFGFLKKNPAMEGFLKNFMSGGPVILRGAAGEAASDVAGYAARLAGHTAGATAATELHAPLAEAFIQDWAHAMKSSIPGADWDEVGKEMGKSLPETMVNMMVLSAYGARSAHAGDISNLDLIARDPQALHFLGFDPRMIDFVVKQPKGAASQAFLAEFHSRNPQAPGDNKALTPREAAEFAKKAQEGMMAPFVGTTGAGASSETAGDESSSVSREGEAPVGFSIQEALKEHFPEATEEQLAGLEAQVQPDFAKDNQEMNQLAGVQRMFRDGNGWHLEMQDGTIHDAGSIDTAMQIRDELAASRHAEAEKAVQKPEGGGDPGNERAVEKEQPADSSKLAKSELSPVGESSTETSLEQLRKPGVGNNEPGSGRAPAGDFTPEEVREYQENHGVTPSVASEEIPLSDLPKGGKWSEEKMQALKDQETAGKPQEPVRFTRENGKLKVDDGLHRIERARERGETHIKAVVTEFVPHKPTGKEPLSIRNESMEAMGESMGKDPMEGLPPDKIADQKARADAEVKKNPGLGKSLVDELQSAPRRLEPWEQFVLDHEAVRLRNAFNESVERLNDPGLSPARRSAENQTLADIEKQIDALRDVAKKEGSRWGKEGRFRQESLNEDYSLSGMRAVFRGKYNKGKELSLEQAEVIRKVHEQIEKASQKHEAAARENEAADVSPAAQAVAEEKLADKSAGDLRKDDDAQPEPKSLKERGLEQFRKGMGDVGSGFSWANPDTVAGAVKVIAGLIQEGYARLKDLVIAFRMETGHELPEEDMQRLVEMAKGLEKPKPSSILSHDSISSGNESNSIESARRVISGEERSDRQIAILKKERPATRPSGPPLRDDGPVSVSKLKESGGYSWWNVEAPRTPSHGSTFPLPEGSTKEDALAYAKAKVEKEKNTVVRQPGESLEDYVKRADAVEVQKKTRLQKVQEFRQKNLDIIGSEIAKGNTPMGLGGLTPESIGAAVKVLASFIAEAAIRGGETVADLFRKFKEATGWHGFSEGDFAKMLPDAKLISETPMDGVLVWQGSPHEFDDPSTAYGGTGEGAQAYGPGLYYAQNRKTGQWYKETLSADLKNTSLKEHLEKRRSEVQASIPESDVGERALEASYPNTAARLIEERGKETAISEFKKARPFADEYRAWQYEREGLEARKASDEEWEEWESREPNGPMEFVHPHLDHEKFLREMEAFPDVSQTEPGYLYNAHIGAEPEEFVDLHKPVEAQPPSVRGAVEKAGMQNEIGGFNPWSEGRLKPPTREQADILKSEGIPGVRYLDSNSRDETGNKSYNYVVFDENLVRHLGKNDEPVSPTEEGYRRALLGLKRSRENSLRRIAELKQQVGSGSGLPEYIYHAAKVVVSLGAEYGLRGAKLAAKALEELGESARPHIKAIMAQAEKLRREAFKEAGNQVARAEDFQKMLSEEAGHAQQEGSDNLIREAGDYVAKSEDFQKMLQAHAEDASKEESDRLIKEYGKKAADEEDFQKRVDAVGNKAALEESRRLIKEIGSKVANEEDREAKFKTRLEEEAEQGRVAESQRLIEEVGKRVAQREDFQKKIADKIRRDEEKEVRKMEKFKSDTLKKTAETRRKTAAGEFGPAPKKALKERDAETERLLADRKAAVLEYERAKEAARLERRSLPEKVLDTIARWKRSAVLTSIPVLGKLSTASLELMMLTPVEDMIGAGVGQVPGLRGIARDAPRHGRLDLSAQAEGVIETWKKLLPNAESIWKTGKLPIDLLYGDKPVHVDKDLAAFLGKVHYLLKAPAKQHEFEVSFAKRARFEALHGQDVSDPSVQLEVAAAAYADANRKIFMEDNVLVDAYKWTLQAMINRADKLKKEGHDIPSLAVKALHLALKWEVPVVRIPTNIVFRTFEYLGGAGKGLFTLGYHVAKGMDKMTYAQKDLVMRNLKLGLFGQALFWIGFFNPASVGGYWQQNRKPRDDEADFGELRINGWNVPAWAIHNPLLECLQFGASFRHIHDAMQKKGHEGSYGSALKQTAWSAAEEIPMVGALKHTIDAASAPAEDKRSWGGEELKGAIPAAVQQTAKWMDPRKDKRGKNEQLAPEGIGQTVETGIPELRENVPVKKKRR